MQKSALAIHDISCVGKCSLTVALPILSACGISTAVLPTAVLSTHTGGFEGYTFRDLTEDIDAIKNHFKDLELTFDALYSGYLGSIEQINKVLDMFRLFKNKSSILFVDPVMADNGKLYSSFDDSFVLQMKELCKVADIITPNLTEACLLVNEEYKETYDVRYIEMIVKKLYDLGPSKVVLTGVRQEDQIGICIFDGGNIQMLFNDYIDNVYHGTGDLFSSVLLGSLLNNITLLKSASIALEVTLKSIQCTTNTDLRYGVMFEKQIPYLCTILKK